MKKIQILIVVDAAGAMRSGSLSSNTYMVDTNKWLGSWNEGKSDLHTLSQDGQILIWNIASVSEGNEVRIEGFSGQIIDQGICRPQKQGIDSDVFWGARVQTRGSGGRYNYVVQVSIEGRSFSFPSCLVVE